MPGRNELLKGTALQETWPLEKPSCFATAYATADSYPWPLAGFETYGEIALDAGDMSGFHNTTTVVLALPRGE